MGHCNITKTKETIVLGAGKPSPKDCPTNWFDFTLGAALTTVTVTQLVPLMGASYNVYLMTLVLQNAAGAADTYVTITNNYLVKLRLELIAGAPAISIPMDVGISGSGATAWTITAETNGAEISAFGTGFRYEPCNPGCC